MVRKVHALHPSAGQRLTNGAGFLQAVHQHCHIGRFERGEGVVGLKAALAVLACVEQFRHVRGAAFGHLGLVGGFGERLVGGEWPERHGGQWLALVNELFTSAFGVYRQKRQRVVAAFFAEQEGPCRVFIGIAEAVVHCLYHGAAGAEVGAQRHVAACGVFAGFQVGEDIRAAKGVNGLLGVADQQHGGVAAGPGDFVHRVEDAVLDGVGVLEFVD